MSTFTVKVFSFTRVKKCNYYKLQYKCYKINVDISLISSIHIFFTPKKLLFYIGSRMQYASVPQSEVKQLVFFLGNFGRCEHRFSSTSKKVFWKKKKNYILKTVYSKHSIVFLKKKIFSDRSWKGFVIKKFILRTEKAWTWENEFNYF